MGEIPKRLRRYYRKVIAYPNRAIVHDGDCRVFSYRICTCGLLHKLRPMQDDATKYYEKFWEEDGEEWNLLHWILIEGKYEEYDEYCKNIKPVSDKDFEKLWDLFNKGRKDSEM